MDELFKVCEETRAQFVEVQLQICLTALEIAAFELRRGNIGIARKEEAAVDKGMLTIEHFLPGVPRPRALQLGAQLAELKEELALLKAALGSQAAELDGNKGR